MIDHPYVITVSSEKGGVGKTTLATNLAIFLKALDEDLHVSIVSFDNHYTVDKMFEIKGQPLKGDVAGFISGITGSDLLHTGQYGVNYIPSSKSLGELKSTVNGALVLARFIAKSRIPGILIIDTRPELDILTQNALFAADRVIIPVKDMASLENCRNIFDMFDRKGFDKKTLSLIPCIIDSRIKFDGPFRDQRSLLKAYAINRGYRCLDTYISKSPKVESLGTNPNGKVYPILTYARYTEVYNQFLQLAKGILEEYSATLSPRSLLFRQWLATEEERSNAEYASRRAVLRPECLLCNRPLIDGGSGPIGYYYETFDGAVRGFLEDKCLSMLLFSTMFNLGDNLAVEDSRYLLFKEATKSSIFVFGPPENGIVPVAEFPSLQMEDTPLSMRVHYLGRNEGVILGRKRGRLETFVLAAMAGYDGKSREGFLLVHPVDPGYPDSILLEENYQKFSRLKNRIRELMSEPSHLTSPDA